MSDIVHIPTAAQQHNPDAPMNYKRVLCDVLENQPTGLTLNGIYAHITELYPYLRHGGPHNWRCRIRNTLTVSQNFTRLPDKHGRRGGKWILTNISPPTAVKRHSCPVGGQMSLVAALAAQQQQQQQQQPLQHHNSAPFAQRPRASSLQVTDSPPQTRGHHMMHNSTAVSSSMPEYYGSAFGMEIAALSMMSANSSPVPSAHAETAAMYHHQPQSANGDLDSLALLQLLTEAPWNNNNLNNNSNAAVNSTQMTFATPYAATRQHTLDMLLDNTTSATSSAQEAVIAHNYLSHDNRGMVTSPPPATHSYNFLDNHVGTEQPLGHQSPPTARQFHRQAAALSAQSSAPVDVPRMTNATRTMSSASMYAFMNNFSSDLSHHVLVAPAQNDVSTSLPCMFRTSTFPGSSPSLLAGKMLSAASIEHITSLASELMSVSY